MEEFFFINLFLLLVDPRYHINQLILLVSPHYHINQFILLVAPHYHINQFLLIGRFFSHQSVRSVAALSLQSVPFICSPTLSHQSDPSDNEHHITATEGSLGLAQQTVLFRMVADPLPHSY